MNEKIAYKFQKLLYLTKRFKRGALAQLTLKWRHFRIFLPDSAPLKKKNFQYCPDRLQKTLLVFLPGISNIVEDYQVHGFIDVVRKMEIETDMIVADAHYGYYATRALVTRLNCDIIDPSIQLGYKNIWLVGISLGGLGSLLYAMEFEKKIKGVILFAPFLGMDFHKKIIADGGLKSWDESLVQDKEWEFYLWLWLKNYQNLSERMPLFLLCGEQDIFAPAHQLLAPSLKGEQVFFLPGGHQWRTWKELWIQFLQKNGRLLNQELNISIGNVNGDATSNTDLS